MKNILSRLKHAVLQSRFHKSGNLAIHPSNLINPEARGSRWHIISYNGLQPGLTYYPVLDVCRLSLVRSKKTYASLTDCLNS